jgi:2-succinyl-5-enolpyruvyl-6-hydroxy-3-cyclohexene-1-carboxylate synthase
MGLKNTSEPLDAPSMFCSRPIFADITSGQRVAKDGPFTGYTVENYDLLLRSNSFRNLCRPDAVIHLGGALVSKALQEHLASVRPDLYVQIADRPGKMDPYNCVTHRLMCTADQFGFFWGPDLPTETHDWPLHLSIASERAGKAMWETLKDQKFPTEIEIAILLGQLAHDYPKDALFLGNSMPIRYFDMYSGFLPQSTHVIANRGASGIDGNIATAAGYAKASGVHVTAVIGDLAALHDLNSLALLKQEGVRVTLIVVNNDGGGIFHFLPIAEHADVFEKYFATPHGMHFGDAARMFGLPYARPATRDEFVNAYNKARSSGTPSIIEVVTDREENERLHRRITDAVAKALEDL